MIEIINKIFGISLSMLLVTGASVSANSRSNCEIDQPQIQVAHILSVKENVDLIYSDQREKELEKLRQDLEAQEEARKVPEEVAHGYIIVVDKTDFVLNLYKDAALVKSYLIEIGTHTPDKETPDGKFQIISKIKNPEYRIIDNDTKEVVDTLAGGDPKNPLGARWLGLNAGINATNSIGIHGVVTPLTIGHASSDGCIRLKNEDVAELYDIVSTGVQVWIGSKDSLISFGVKL